MFKLASEPTFRHEVTIAVPVDGGHVNQTVTATFRVLPTSEVATFEADVAGNTQLLERALVKVDDVVGDDGKPLPWSDELKQQLIDVPYARLALTTAYGKAVSKAAAGN